MTPQTPSASRKSLNRHLFVGVVVALVLVAGLGGWSAYANIAGAVISSGTIVVEGQRKKVQHKEGGIVGAIHVKEGDRVTAGQPVVTLDDKLPRANLGIVSKQIDKLEVRIARLSAERDGKPQINFSVSTLARAATEVDVASAIAGEKSLFAARREILQAQRSQSDERVRRLQEEIAGLIAQRDAKKEEIDFIEEELSGLEKLHKDGHVTLTRIIALKRQRTRLKGELGQLIASIGSAHGRIAEVKIQLTQFEQQSLAEVARDLRDAEGQINELQERKTVAEDQLQRLDIVAPVLGFVHELRVHTVGGVIPPGETVLSVIPADESLFIQARVSPVDIDQLYVGQKANVRFTAFNQRTTPEFTGYIEKISPDLSTNPNTGESYYTLRLRYEIPKNLPDGAFQVVPGMPVEVLVQTGDRTALSYFVKPLSDHIARVFREE